MNDFIILNFYDTKIFRRYIYIIEVLYFNINNTIIKLLLTEVIIISV